MSRLQFTRNVKTYCLRKKKETKKKKKTTTTTKKKKQINKQKNNNNEKPKLKQTLECRLLQILLGALSLNIFCVCMYYICVQTVNIFSVQIV